MRGTETVLLVEDENAVRHPAFEFLKQCGYNVIEAKDGLQAIDSVHKHGSTIDVMVTDVVMPGMSGGQLCGVACGKISEDESAIRVRVFGAGGSAAQDCQRSHEFSAEAFHLEIARSEGERGPRCECGCGRRGWAVGRQVD
jgi:CheY-like chemotaxis protein